MISWIHKTDRFIAFLMYFKSRWIIAVCQYVFFTKSSNFWQRILHFLDLAGVNKLKRNSIVNHIFITQSQME